MFIYATQTFTATDGTSCTAGNTYTVTDAAGQIAISRGQAQRGSGPDFFAQPGIGNVNNTKTEVSEGADYAAMLLDTNGNTVEADSLTVATSYAGNLVYDAVSNGTTTVTSATANFTQADVGKIFAVVTQDNVSGAMRTYGKTGTIVSVSSATSVVVSLTINAKTGMLMVYGPDIGAMLNSVMTSLSASGGGIINFPAGIFLTSLRHTIPNNVGLNGAGNAPQALGTSTSRGYIGYFGTSLFYAGAYAGGTGPFLQLGAVNSEKTASSLRNMNVDCMQEARDCVVTNGWGANIQNCTLVGGTRYTLFTGPSMVVSNSVIAGMGVNHVVNTAGFDFRIVNNYIWGAATNKAGVQVYDVDDGIIANNHIFRADNATNTNAVSVYYDTANLNGNIIIANNIFDDIYGDDILVTLTGGSTEIRALTITGNNSFSSSNPTSNTYSFIKFSVASGCKVNGYTVSANSKRGSIYNTTLSTVKSFADGAGIVGNAYGSFVGNTCSDVATTFYTTMTPTHSSGNIQITTGGVASVV